METNKIYCGDAEIKLKGFSDDTFDSFVSDPPYGLKFMGKHWDYDIPKVSVFQEMYRTLKPGGYILIACGTRTQHRMAVNIEDSGFEIRDVISWIYGSGFPKSLDISKAIDKKFGAERNIIKTIKKAHISQGNTNEGWERPSHHNEDGSFKTTMDITEPSTDEAKQWQGYGTSLKPAQEFWTLARKPLSEKTVAENVLKHGTGGINIDATRIKQEVQENGASFYTHLSCLYYSLQKSFSSPIQLCDYLERIFSVLDSYSNYDKAPSHNLAFSVNNQSIKFLDEPYDSTLLYQNGALYVQKMIIEQDSQSDYPTLFHLYDEHFQLEAVSCRYAFQLLSDVRKYISRSQDLKENNQMNYNNLPLFSFLAFPYLIFNEFIKIILHEDRKYLSNPENLGGPASSTTIFGKEKMSKDDYIDNSKGLGRFPSNVILDEFMGKELDKQTGILTSGTKKGIYNSWGENGIYGIGESYEQFSEGDSGGASRFFYCAKADNFQRNKGLKDFDKVQVKHIATTGFTKHTEDNPNYPRANIHPTVKPIDLMRYLVKLITPKGGLTCDPFCGSGTTLIGAKLELINYIGIEREKEYCKIAEARIAAWNPDKYKEQILF